MAILFKQKESEYLKMFLRHSKRKFYQKNVHIYRRGDVGNGFYLLEKGLVKITTKTAKGEDYLLKVALPEQIFGIESMDSLFYYTTAKAVKDSVVYFFPTEDVKQLMETYDSLEFSILESIINEMSILAFKIYEDKLPAYQKVARLLLNVYYDYNKYHIPLTQKDLASCTGYTRVTIYKILKELEENGCIRRTRNDITVVDRSILKEYADGIRQCE